MRGLETARRAGSNPRAKLLQKLAQQRLPRRARSQSQNPIGPKGAGQARAAGGAKERAKKGWAVLRAAMRGHWKPFLGSIGAGLVASAVVAIFPLLLGAAVNDGLLGHHWGRFGEYLGLIGALGVLLGLASGTRRRLNGIVSRQVESELRLAFHSHLLGLDLNFHQEANRGQLLSRLTSDLFQIQAMIASSPLWLANGALAVAIAVIVVRLNPLLGLVCLVPLPFVAVVSTKFSRQVREMLAELQRRRGHLAGVVEETLAGIRAVKGFGAEAAMRRSLGTAAHGVWTDAMRVVRTRAKYAPFLNSVPVVELAVVNWLGGWLVLQGRLSVGLLVAFNAYLGALTAPLQSIGAYIVLVQRAVVSAWRIGSVLERQSLIREPEGGVELPAGQGALRLEEVCFAYPGSKRLALDHVSLEVSSGELVGLVGATGSGKSTLLMLLLRLYDPLRGAIYLDGVDIKHVALGGLRRAVAIVFQDSLLLDGTVAENIWIGRPTAKWEEVQSAAELACVDEFVNDLPLGYETRVGEAGGLLSGGQRQRIALARALLADPRLLLLDEATSAVDARTERRIVKNVLNARRDKTTLMVAHRAFSLALTDRVVVLDSGRVTAVGEHESLLRASLTYRRALGMDEERRVSA